MYIMNRPNYGTKTAGGNPRIYNCQVCDRAFTREEHLTRHTQSTHNKLKPFCCGICSRPFSRRDLLLRHAKNLHQGSELAVSRIRRLYKRTGSGGDALPGAGSDAGIMGEEYSPENSPSYTSPTSPDLAPSLPLATSDSVSSIIPHLAYKQSTSSFQPSASTLLAAAAASSAPENPNMSLRSQPQMRGRSVSNPTTLAPILGLPLHTGHRHSNHEIHGYSDSMHSSTSNSSSNSNSSYSNYPKTHHTLNSNSSSNVHQNLHKHHSNSFGSSTIPPLYPSTYTTAPRLLSPVLPSPLPNINVHNKNHVPNESHTQNGNGNVSATSPNENDEAEEVDTSPAKKGKKKQKMSVQMLVS